MMRDEIMITSLSVLFLGVSSAIPGSGIVTPSTVAAQSDPYARYTTPGECAMILNRMERRFWRARRPDTVYAGRYGQAPQRASVAEVKSCVARFNVETVAERDLMALGYAYVRAQEPAKAEYAFQRLLTAKAKKSVADRANALVQIIDIYSKDRPTQIAKAREYLHKLDALGVPAAAERLVAHLEIYEAARMADSVPLVEEEARAAIQASNEIAIDSVKRQRAFTSASAWAALAYWYNRTGDGTRAVETLEQGRIALAPLKRAIGFGATIAQYKLLGTPAPQIQATRWFNDRHHTIYPTLGTVSTITFVSHGCHPATCYPGYAVARRLRGAGDGVSPDLIFVSRLEGYYRQNVVEPAREFDLSSKYFLEYLKLPVTLGTWQTDFGLKPDGRLDVLSDPNGGAYHPSDSPSLQTYVIDKTGKVRFITNMLPQYEVELSNVLKDVSR